MNTRQKRAFVTLFIVMFVTMLGMGIVGPLMVIFAKSMGASGFWLGLMYSGFALTRATMQPVCGWFSDKMSRKTFMVVGLFLYVFVSLGYAIAADVYQLTGVRLLHGLGSAMVIPVAEAYIGDIIPKGKEGTYMGLFWMSLYLGMAAGPLLGGTLTDLYGMNSAFYTMAAVAGVAFLLLVFFVPAIQPHERHGQGKVTPVRIMLKDNKIKAVGLYLAARAVLRQSISAFLPLYAVQNMGLSVSEAGMLVTVYLLTEALSQIWVGPLADRFDRKTLMIIGGIFAAVLGFFLNQMVTSWTMLLILIPIAIMGTIGRVPAIAFNVENGLKYGRMGSSMGITNAAQDMGSFIGPFFTGWALDYYGLGSVFYVGSIFGVIAMPIMAYWLYSKDSNPVLATVTEVEASDPPK
jgi:DHA1 family multidrug resistance protein-like MFS transporter